MDRQQLLLELLLSKLPKEITPTELRLATDKKLQEIYDFFINDGPGPLQVGNIIWYNMTALRLDHIDIKFLPEEIKWTGTMKS